MIIRRGQYTKLLTILVVLLSITIVAYFHSESIHSTYKQVNAKINSKPKSTEQDDENNNIKGTLSEEESFEKIVHDIKTTDDADTVDSEDNKQNDLNDQEANPKYHQDWDGHKKDVMSFVYSDSLHDKTLSNRKNYFSKMFKIIEEFKPDVEPLLSYKNDEKEKSQDANRKMEPYLTHEELLTHLIIPDNSMYNLKFNHEKFVSHLPDEMPQDIYTKNSKGIVYVGGNRFSWLTILSIMNIRQNNCDLPVEVLIPTYDEYQLKFCKELLPKYNAKCIYLPRLVGNQIFEEHKFKGFQYKSLALALSSFEEVLLLDADNTPLGNPLKLFESKPFSDIGLTFWPDFWKRSTNPKFYDIIGQDIDLTKRRDFGYVEYGTKFQSITPDDVTLFHQLEGTLPDPSCESGQLMISKRKHFGSLILALYYNTYGPGYYYPLLTQGASGEGDKETFMAAAHALGEKYYNVKKRLESLYMKRDDHYIATAMGQFDPIKDFELSEKYANEDIDVKESPEIFMLHSNNPKLDPWKLKNDGMSIDKQSGQRNRIYQEKFIDTAKYDFELRLWKNMEKLLCEENHTFLTFQNQGVTSAEVCVEVKAHLEYLEETTRAPN